MKTTKQGRIDAIARVLLGKHAPNLIRICIEAPHNPPNIALARELLKVAEEVIDDE